MGDTIDNVLIFLGILVVLCFWLILIFVNSASRALRDLLILSVIVYIGSRIYKRHNSEAYLELKDSLAEKTRSIMRR